MQFSIKSAGKGIFVYMCTMGQSIIEPIGFLLIWSDIGHFLIIPSRNVEYNNSEYKYVQECTAFFLMQPIVCKEIGNQIIK